MLHGALEPLASQEVLCSMELLIWYSLTPDRYCVAGFDSLLAEHSFLLLRRKVKFVQSRRIFLPERCTNNLLISDSYINDMFTNLSGCEIS